MSKKLNAALIVLSALVFIVGLTSTLAQVDLSNSSPDKNVVAWLPGLQTNLDYGTAAEAHNDAQLAATASGTAGAPQSSAIVPTTSVTITEKKSAANPFREGIIRQGDALSNAVRYSETLGGGFLKEKPVELRLINNTSANLINRGGVIDFPSGGTLTMICSDRFNLVNITKGFEMNQNETYLATFPKITQQGTMFLLKGNETIGSLVVTDDMLKHRYVEEATA